MHRVLCRPRRVAGRPSLRLPLLEPRVTIVVSPFSASASSKSSTSKRSAASVTTLEEGASRLSKADKTRLHLKRNRMHQEEARQEQLRDRIDGNSSPSIAASQQRSERLKQLERELESKLEEQVVLQRQNVVMRSFPRWLDDDPECFRQTMEALKLQSSSSRDQQTGDGSSGTGLFREYKLLYKDSIPTFVHGLQQSAEVSSHPKDEGAHGSVEQRHQHRQQQQPTATNHQPLSPAMEKALDTMVECGFADLHFSKAHREMNFNKHKYIRAESRLVKIKEKLERRRLAIEALKADLENMTAELEEQKGQGPAAKVNNKDGLASEEDSPSPTPSSPNILKAAMNTLSSFWGGVLSEKHQPKDDSAVTEVRVDNDCDAPVKTESEPSEILKKLKHQLKIAQGDFRRVQKQLTDTERQGDMFKPGLSDEVYQHANQVLASVLPTISQEFARHIRDLHANSIEQYQLLDAHTDLTKPQEWYLHARLDRRKIIFHAGPTNSGKTYNALQRLKKAKRGLYLGPLRLLAAEIYEKLTWEGHYASLITGQEKREIPFSTHWSATVEMAAQVDEEYDVVVIDEIQMIRDEYRGFAWTRALHSLRCKEIHVCGGMETEEMVRNIAKACGDEFEIRQYERFTSLEVSPRALSKRPGALGSYKNVEPGDCVVAFSRNDIFAIQREIENTTPYKCCIIYGSLPPETRTDQARRFNNPDSGYDILVASDAVGMGLNLHIRRIIFNSMYKSTGMNVVLLDHSSVKQIAGRAGRRNSPYPNGEVTCRDPRDMEYLRACMAADVQPIRRAGLLPTPEHIRQFSEALATYGLSMDHSNLDQVLVQFSNMATVRGDYFLCRQEDMRLIARLLAHIDLPIRDKYMLTMAPIRNGEKGAYAMLQKFALKISRGETAGVGRVLIKEPKTFDDLSHLCNIHDTLGLFLWLHHKFPGSNLMEQQSALSSQQRVIQFITAGLAGGKLQRLDHCYVTRDGRLRRVFRKKLAADKSLRMSEDLPPGYVHPVGKKASQRR